MALQNQIKHLKEISAFITNKMDYLIRDYERQYGVGGYTDEDGKEIRWH